MVIFEIFLQKYQLLVLIRSTLPAGLRAVGSIFGFCLGVPRFDSQVRLIL